MLTPSGSQPTATPLGLKQEAGTLTPPDEDEVELPADPLDAAELLVVGLDTEPESYVGDGATDEVVEDGDPYCEDQRCRAETEATRAKGKVAIEVRIVKDLVHRKYIAKVTQFAQRMA